MNAECLFLADCGLRTAPTGEKLAASAGSDLAS